MPASPGDPESFTAPTMTLASSLFSMKAAVTTFLLGPSKARTKLFGSR